MSKYILICIITISFLLQSCNTKPNQFIPRVKKNEADNKLAKASFIKTSIELSAGKRKREDKKYSNRIGPKSKSRKVEVMNQNNENTAPRNTYNRELPKRKQKTNEVSKSIFINNSESRKITDLNTKRGTKEPKAKIRKIEVENKQTHKKKITVQNTKQEKNCNVQQVVLYDILEKKELVKKIRLKLSYYDRLHFRQVNKKLYNIFSGYDQVGLRGVTNRPVHNNDIYSSIYNYTINFPEAGESKEPMPKTLDTIPSFIFYQVMKWVKKLPKEFWPYIKDTKIEILSLNWMGITDEEVGQLGKYLQGSKVIGINLETNQITYKGVEELAQNLLQTYGNQDRLTIVQQVVLKDNSIESQEEQLDIKKKYPAIDWIF